MNRLRLFTVSLLVLACAASSTVLAQKKKLTFRLTSGRGSNVRLLNPLPAIEGWLDDEHYLLRRNNDLGVPVLYSISAQDSQSIVYVANGELNKKLPLGMTIPQAVAHSDDYCHFLFNQNNDLYYFNQSGTFKQLTSTPAAEQTPKFSPDFLQVAFTRDHNLYVVDIAQGREKQLTHDGSDVILNGYNSWIYYEEVYNRDWCAFWWSPTSDKLAFIRYDNSPVPLFTLFCADSVHGRLETEHYPKAGDPNPLVNLGVVDVSTGRTLWIKTDDKTDQYVARPFWRNDGSRLYFQWLNRGQDWLKIFLADLHDGSCHAIYEERQAGWVEFFENIYLLKNGNGFILKSDKSGWPHLYYHDPDGRMLQQLTSGDWSVKEIARVDEKNSKVYFTANYEKSTETHLCCVGLNGKNFRRLTSTAGSHSVKVSPNGNYFIDTWSCVQQPTRVELVSGRGQVIRCLGDANSSALSEYQLGQAELFAIPTADGYQMPTVWILPSDLDKSKKYPVLISIYGGPGAATVSNSWQSLRNHYYAQNGIIYLAVDHRGSGHFGKKGEALMHRCLGKWEMNDYIDAVKWLQRLPFVDSTRIAITGGSYGGYVTCLALTYGAGYFTHGIAEFSVTDYRLYDSIYTERYMDLPSENSSGYDSTSVMKWVDRYHGLLRITHGTMDDNVHMQNTLQLIDKLQDAGKHFELMLYPNGRHGYGASKGRHAGEESMRFWFRNLLNREWSAEE
jgi:dipeptidyl-peptidase 4